MTDSPRSLEPVSPWVPSLATCANAAGLVVAVAYTATGAARHTRRGSDTVPPTTDPPDDVSPGEVELWAWQSAVRTLSYVAPLTWSYLRSRAVAPELLVAAGIAQLGDSAIGLRRHNAQMATAPAVMAVIHFVTAGVIRRRLGPSSRGAVAQPRPPARACR